MNTLTNNIKKKVSNRLNVESKSKLSKVSKSFKDVAQPNLNSIKNIQNKNHQNLLLECIYKNDANTLKLLAKRQSNLNIKINSKIPNNYIENFFMMGFTPLHMATWYNNDHIFVKLLIRMGSNVNARADNGKTPLEFCIRNNDLRSVKALVKAGAHVNLLWGSLINSSISASSFEITQYLLNKGAKLDNDSIGYALERMCKKGGRPSIEDVKIGKLILNSFNNL